MDEEFTFQVQQLAEVLAMGRGTKIAGERFDVEEKVEATRYLIALVLDIATQEEPMMRIPADWWQAFKERWYPQWLKKKSPVKYKEIVAVHRFPELEVPHEVLGREFVHLKIVDVDKMVKEQEEERWRTR